MSAERVCARARDTLPAIAPHQRTPSLLRPCARDGSARDQPSHWALSSAASGRLITQFKKVCTGQSLGNYYARAVGGAGTEGFEIIDHATLAALHQFVPLDWEDATNTMRLEIQLPPRLGGLGFRSLAAVAPLAYAAANVAARHNRGLLVPDGSMARLRGDPLMDAALPRPGSKLSSLAPLAAEAAISHFHGTASNGNQQKALTRKLDEAIAQRVLDTIPESDGDSWIRVIGNRGPAAEAG